MLLLPVQILRLSSRGTSSITVETKIAKLTNNAVIDTGSDINIVNIKLIPRKLHYLINTAERIQYGTSNGATTMTVGSIFINLRLCTQIQRSKPLIINSKFHVHETIQVNILIGLPILKNTFVNMMDNVIVFFPPKYSPNESSRKMYKGSVVCQLLPRWQHNALCCDWIDKINSIKDPQNLLANDPMIIRNGNDADKSNENTKKSSVTINPELPHSVILQIQQIVNFHSDKCFKTEGAIPLFKNGNHTPLSFPLTSNTYTKPPLYKLSFAHQKLAAEQINKWRKDGVVVVQDRDVPYETPLLVVPKKDAPGRVCIDARSLNSIIANENIALPQIHKIVSQMSGFNYYTVLDISSYFLNFKLDRDSSDLLTFTDPISKIRMRFTRTPFGVKKSMENSVLLLRKELDALPDHESWLIMYVDDAVIFTMTIEEHLLRIKQFFNLISSLNIRIKPSKTSIGFSTIDQFGFHISKDGFTISPSRYESIMNLQTPKNKKELIKILGITGYFRELLPPDKPVGYFVSVFRDITNEKAKFEWTEEHDQYWMQYKDAIKRKLKLQKLLETDLNVIVRTDSSHTHYGGTLSVIRNNEEILVATVSHAWSPTASRYHITRLELLAILLTLGHFKYELIGRKVTVVTDNVHSYYIMTHPEKISVEGTLIPRLLSEIRWVNYTMEKSDNKDPKWALVDQLSRMKGGHRIKARNMAEILSTEDDPDPTSLLATHKFNDFKIVKSPELLNIATPLLNLRQFQDIKTEILNSEGFLKHGKLTQEQKDTLLNTLHLTGHLGSVRMATILMQSGISWKNRNRDISDVVRKCSICGVFKPNNNPLDVGPMIQNDRRPKKTLAIDITTIGQPAILNVLVVVDLITGFLSAVRIPGQMNSKNIIFRLLQILSRYAPQVEYLKMDNATYFRSKDFTCFLEALGVTPIYVSRSNHRGNGKIERGIGSLQNQLRLMKISNLNNTAHVDLALDIACLLINLRPSNRGFSPYMLVFGHDLETKSTLLPTLNPENLNDYQKELYKRISDLHSIIQLSDDSPPYRPNIRLLDPGDTIRIKMPQPKGSNKIQAPIFSEQIFVITSVDKGKGTYRIQNLYNINDERVIHARYTRRYLTKKEKEKINLESTIIAHDAERNSHKIIKSRTTRRSSQQISPESNCRVEESKDNTEDQLVESPKTNPPEIISSTKAESEDSLSDNEIKTQPRYFTRFQKAKTDRKCLMCFQLPHHQNCHYS